MNSRTTFRRWAAGLVLAVASTRSASAQVADERCLECHSQVPIVLLQVRFADGEEVSPFVDRDNYLHSAHGTLPCTACHDNCHPEFQVGFEPSNAPPRPLPTRRQYKLAIDQKCRGCHEPGGDAGVKHISEVLHPTGSDETPLCADCHQPHAMRPIEERGIAIDRACADCHEDVYREFTASVHASALADPANPDLPHCTSCHFGHEGGGRSLAARRVRLGRPCMGCHGDAQLMQRYELSPDVVTTYLDDFHGTSVKFYGQDSPDAARFILVCADCHGIHNVKQASGLAAATLKAQLQTVCSECHEDAGANFADAWLSHSKPSLSSNVLVYLVKAGYTILIPFVIAGLMIHIVSDLVVQPLRTRAQRAANSTRSSDPTETAGVGPSDSNIPKYFVRFSRRQRAEHLVVLTTFVLLIATGLPQKFHDTAWAETTIRWFGGIDSARLIHRVSGFLMTGVALLHFITVGASVLFRKTPLTMVPVKKDFEDAIGTLKYHLGLADKAPKADRFTYGEKFEYWGMILGTLVMVASGFILIYPTVLTQYIPGQIIAAAKVAHSYEAMMALLTIVVWHMYGARFDPCIFTGKISRERLEHHHPLEYERLIRRAAVVRSDRPRHSVSTAKATARPVQTSSSN